MVYSCLRVLSLVLLLAVAVHAQITTFVPVCAGTDDTSKFTTLIATIGSNTATIELPFKNGTRCAVNSLTIPANVAVDNTRGTGLKVNSAQVLTMLGAIVNPVGKPLFFGPGTVLFTGNTRIGRSGQSLVSDGVGGQGLRRPDDSFNVLEYGAVGNGVANDTAAIQAAINACVTAGGGVVYLPRGTYHVTGLTVSAGGVTLVGAGHSTRIAMTRATGDTLSFGTGSTQLNAIGVENMRFEPTVARTSGSEIHAPRFSYLKLDHLYFINAFRAMKLGAAANASAVTWVSRIRAQGCWQTLKTVRVLALWADSWAVDSARKDSPIAIHLDGGTEGGRLNGLDVVNTVAFAAGPTVTGGGVALLIDTDEYTATDAAHVWISDSFLDSHEDGLRAIDGRNIKLTTVWFNGTRGYGAILNAGTNGYGLTNCTFWSSGDSGIALNGSNHNITDSFAVSNGLRAGTARVGIYVTPTATGFRLRGNRAFNGWGGSSVQFNGIFIEAGADNFIVKDNDVRGNLSTGLVNKAGTSATKIVGDNIQ